MFEVVITASAEKDIRRLTSIVKKCMTIAIFALSDDPRPAGSLKIKSEEGAWRIRVGDYRIAYTIDNTGKIVTIMRVGPRDDFYN